MAKFHQLTIKDIQKETSDCVAISFKVTDSLKDVFTYSAGQYISLKINIEGQEIRRDYSLCSSPQSGDLTVAVKQVKDGRFSVYANTILKVGDALEVSPPNGRFVFTADPSKSRVITAFAAGSGITPVMSIVKAVLEQEPLSSVILVYGNKTPKDAIFFNEIIALQNKFEDRLHLQFVYSQSDETDALFGRIDTSVVNYITKNKFKNKTIDAFYLCGPEEMINTVRTTLTEGGTAESNIFYELFTTADTNNKVEVEPIAKGKTKITVLVDDEETTFEMSQEKSILQAALDADLDAPYSCQGGICSSCLARLTEGKATMRQNNILTDSELDEGLILTCQAHPTTAAIFVNYDDV